jgi:hypothetical protein
MPPAQLPSFFAPAPPCPWLPFLLSARPRAAGLHPSAECHCSTPVSSRFVPDVPALHAPARSGAGRGRATLHPPGGQAATARARATLPRRAEAAVSSPTRARACMEAWAQVAAGLARVVPAPAHTGGEAGRGGRARADGRRHRTRPCLRRVASAPDPRGRPCRRPSDDSHAMYHRCR